MVTTNIKHYPDEQIVALTDGIAAGEIPCGIDDLKKLLAEVQNRKLDARYVHLLTTLISDEITGKRTPQPAASAEGSFAKRPVGERRQAPEIIAEFADNRQDGYDDDDGYYEKFPFLAFLAGFHRFLAWFFLAAATAGGVTAGFLMFQGNILMIAACVLGGVVAGTLLMLIFYVFSEKIHLSLEMERHLRRIGKD